MTRNFSFAICVSLLMVLSNPSPAHAQSLTPAAVCGTATRHIPLRDSVPNLSGIWDFKLDMGTAVSSGMMVLGALDDAYGGALTPNGGPVAIRRLTLKGDAVHMTVASREGDVLFNGHLLATANELCGVVTYHGGKLYPMTAVRRAKNAERSASAR